VFPLNLLTRGNRAVAKPVTKRTLLLDSPEVKLISGQLSQDQLTATTLVSCSNTVSSHERKTYSAMGRQSAKRFVTVMRRFTTGIRSAVAYPGIFSWEGGGGSTNSVEERGETERGSGGR